MRQRTKLRNKVAALTLEVADLEAVLEGPPEGIEAWRSQRRAVRAFLARAAGAEEVALLGPFDPESAPTAGRPS